MCCVWIKQTSHDFYFTLYLLFLLVLQRMEAKIAIFRLLCSYNSAHSFVLVNKMHSFERLRGNRATFPSFSLSSINLIMSHLICVCMFTVLTIIEFQYYLLLQSVKADKSVLLLKSMLTPGVMSEVQDRGCQVPLRLHPRQSLSSQE